MNWTDTHKQLYAAACGFLARREYGQMELRKRLAKKFEEASPRELKEVLDFLSMKNFQSDERYAYSLTKSKFNKFYGPAYIKQFAFNKGVDRRLIEKALEEFDFGSKCQEFAFKHAHVDRSKLQRKILQKGYDYSHMISAVKNLD